ncbi:MAG TPA: KR domain-containing protein, partial [Thermoanaerobaculia bacterium]
KDFDGWKRWSRKKYWGFDVDKLPLNARVWYPEGPGPFPLALIVEAAATDPGYWAQHLRRTVRFGAGVAELARTHPDAVLLEVGPGRTLATLARHVPEAAGCLALPTMRHPGEALSDLACLLETVGKLWVVGGEVDWEGLHRGHHGHGGPGDPAGRRRRVPLPTYPFERQRYWIERGKASGVAGGGIAGDAATALTAARRRADPAEWFSVPSWRRSAAPALVHPGGTGASGASDAGAGRGRPWLLFADRCGLAARMAALLAAGGHEVATVAPGERFESLGSGAYRLDPARPEDYGELLRRLDEEGRGPATIAHLWSVTGGAAAAGLPGEEEEQRLGFYSLLALAQALAERPARPVRLGVVADGMQAVGEDDLWAPGKATLLGPCRVMPQELTHLACRSIDIDLAGDRGGDEPARLLIDELAAGDGEPVVAYRGRQRWVQTFEPVRLAFPGGRSLLRQGGVYLLTGGLGGVGLALAAELAAAVRARLVLVGRQPAPPPAAWEGLASAGDRQARGLLALAAAGAEVLTASGRLANRRDPGVRVHLTVRLPGGEGR